MAAPVVVFCLLIRPVGFSVVVTLEESVRPFFTVDAPFLVSIDPVRKKCKSAVCVYICDNQTFTIFPEDFTSRGIDCFQPEIIATVNCQIISFF